MIANRVSCKVCREVKGITKDKNKSKSIWVSGNNNVEMHEPRSSTLRG